MEYRCDAGHPITTVGERTLDRCPSAICLKPWLTAYGDGSQAENRRLKGLRIEERNKANERLFG